MDLNPVVMNITIDDEGAQKIEIFKYVDKIALMEEELKLNATMKSKCGDYGVKLVTEYDFVKQVSSANALTLTADGNSDPGYFDNSSLNVTLTLYFWTIPVKVTFIKCDDARFAEAPECNSSNKFIITIPDLEAPEEEEPEVEEPEVGTPKNDTETKKKCKKKSSTESADSTDSTATDGVEKVDANVDSQEGENA